MVPFLRLRLLGTPGIDGQAGPLSGAAAQGQPLALLALLACAGDRGVPRDKLLALLWPEAAADRGSHRLSQLAHSTRRALASPDLVVGSAELRLNPEQVACDLWDFAESRRNGDLSRAAALYGGPFLDGFFLPDSGEFEHWVESRRATLAREHQETIEALAVQSELRGDSRAAAEWWRRLAEHEPLSSRVTMHLMTALAAAGDRARALEQARVYQHQVRSELEAEPNPAVLALAAQLRQMSPNGPAASVAPRFYAIGVLPLVSLEEGAEAERLACGLTEELTTAAAALPGVRVSARTSVAAICRITQDVREIGARLGLAAVLEGTIRESGGRVRLTVRLVNVSDGCHLWTKRYERERLDGFEAQDALAREVADAMHGALERLGPAGSRTG
jgi:TolB-like protein